MSMGRRLPNFLVTYNTKGHAHSLFLCSAIKESLHTRLERKTDSKDQTAVQPLI